MSEQIRHFPKAEPVTLEQAAALRDAAIALREIATTAGELAWKSYDDPRQARGSSGNLGRLAEAAETAEDVLFNVLNCAESRCDVAIPGGLVAFWRPRPDELG